MLKGNSQIIMVRTSYSEPARLSTCSKPLLLLTKTAGQQPGSGHPYLRSLDILCHNKQPQVTHNSTLTTHIVSTSAIFLSPFSILSENIICKLFRHFRFTSIFYISKTSISPQLFLSFSLNEFQMSAILSMRGYVVFPFFFFVSTFFDKNAEAKINQNFKNV